MFLLASLNETSRWIDDDDDEDDDDDNDDDDDDNDDDDDDDSNNNDGRNSIFGVGWNTDMMKYRNRLRCQKAFGVS